MLSSEVSSLKDRWANCQHFTLLVPEFSCGLAFLSSWYAWKKDPHQCGRLHVIGLVPRLSSATELLSQLKVQVPEEWHSLVENLVSAWPFNLPGLHRIDFEDGAVTLTLGVGDRNTLLERLRAKVDFVWPSELPSFEKEEIAQRMAKSACLSSSWDQFAVTTEVRNAMVIGAGFAGMGVAYALALRGWAVTVIDRHGVGNASTHDGHHAAALTPMVTRDDDLRARLSRAGSLRAQVRWGRFPESVIKFCGAIQLQRDQGRIVDLAAVIGSLGFPSEWAHYVDASQASAIAGINLSRGGIYFQTAAQVNPPRLIDALSKTPGLRMVQGEVVRLSKQGDQWHALDARNEILAHANYVVVASALDSFNILNKSNVLPPRSRLSKMHALAGEITYVQQTDLAGGPHCIVSGDGYVLPAVNGVCATGSSYAHGAEYAVTTQVGRAGNIKRAAGLLNNAQLEVQLQGVDLPGWAGWRAVLPGRLPVVGPVPDTYGLWVACGLASRGLTWAPLAGDLIAAALNAEPLPLENDIIDAISAI